MARNSKVEYRQIEMLHKVSVVALGVMAVLSLWLIKDGSFTLQANFLTKDVLQSSTETVLAPAARNLFDVNLRYALAGILLFSAAWQGLSIMRWRKKYKKGLKNRNNWLRWLGSGVFYGLLVEVVGIVSGVRDLGTLKMMGLSTLLGFVLCGLADQAGTKPKNPPKVLFWSAVVAKALPWVLIVSSMVGTHIYGLSGFGWHVYATAAILLVASTLGAANLWFSLIQRGRWADYLFVEQSYLRLDILAKVLISAVLIV